MPDEEEMPSAYIMRKVPSKRKKLLYILLLHGGEIERPLIPRVVFSLKDYTDASCELEFRFNVAGLQRLCILLRVPDAVITTNRDRATGIEALYIVLSRLVYPLRYYDLIARFGLPRGVLSRIFLHMIDHGHAKFAEKIFFAHNLVEERMLDYCAAISSKGSPIDTIFGFPDGTKLCICRPAPRPGAPGENLL